VADFAHARRYARWSMLVFGLSCYSVSSDAIAAEPAGDVDACIGFRNETGDKLLTVHARNSCDRRLACTLDYTVLCEDAQEKTTSRASKSTSFQLGKQASRDLSLSAADCKQGWRIDELSWTCS
jgi:hypothetical protein